MDFSDGNVKRLGLKKLVKDLGSNLQKGAELTPEERLALDASIKQVQEKKKLIAYAEQDLLIFEKILSSDLISFRTSLLSVILLST